MISKFFNKLKSIFVKNSSPVITKTTKDVAKKTTSKTSKSSKKSKTSKASKATKTSKVSKSKKKGAKIIVDSFTKLPGVGAKSAQAFFEAGFKTPQDIISAKEKDLLAIPGVGLNLVKKLKSLKL